MEQPNIAIANPNILNVDIMDNLERLDDYEVFVELPKYKGYYISSHGRVYSTKSNKLIKQTYIGRDKNRASCTLRKTGKSEETTLIIAGLVGEIFCDHSDIEGKYLWHHKDYNPFNNRWDNLVAMPYKVHSRLHSGSRVYLYNNQSGLLKPYLSKSAICDYLGIGYQKLDYAIRKIRKGRSIAVIDGIGIAEINNIVGADNLPIFIGCKMDAVGDDRPDDSLTIVSLLPSLMQTQNTK